MSRRNYKHSRLNAEGVAAMKRNFDLRFPGRTAQVITDTPSIVQGAGIVWELPVIAFVAGDAFPDAITGMPRDQVTPLLAFDCDDSAARVAEHFIDLGTPYLACPATDTALHMHVRRPVRMAIAEVKAKAAAAGLSHVDAFDFCNLAQAIETTAEIDGKYVEIGVFKGTSAMFALTYMKAISLPRSCVFMDVFEGFVYPESKTSADAFWHNTHVDGHPMAIVADRLGAYADDRLHVDVRKHNIISDPLPADLDPIVVANLDVDIYDAVHAGLVKLAPRMAPGGVIVCEDPGHSGQLIGARVAVNKFLRTPAGRRFMPINMESGQVMLIHVRPAD